MESNIYQVKKKTPALPSFNYFLTSCESVCKWTLSTDGLIPDQLKCVYYIPRTIYSVEVSFSSQFRKTVHSYFCT